MRIDESKRRMLLDLTVKVVLELRALYLSKSDANTLKHWQMIHDRLRMAARTTSSVPEWVTQMQVKLQLPTPGSSLSSEAAKLAHEVECLERPSAWLDLLEREHSYIMALARGEAEDRKAQREAGKLATVDLETGEVFV